MKIFKSLFTIVVFALFLAFPKSAHAGSDLTVTCGGSSPCAVVPAGTPMFLESNWFPGSTVTERVRVTNNTAQSGFVAIEAQNYVEIKNLGEVVSLNIHRDTPAGTLLYSVPMIDTFVSDGYFTISPISAGQTLDFYFTALMATSAGNPYQASSLQFDLKVGTELTPITPPSGGTTNNGNSVNVTSNTGGNNQGCADPAPGSAPNVYVLGSGTNTITIGWSSVSPVSHYALIFTRLSDGAQFGSTNIGNGNSYTISGISGSGATYSFDVFGVNGCMPGSRGTTTSTIQGAFLATRPLGQDNQVLGVSDEEEAQATPSASPDVKEDESTKGSVLGAKICDQNPWWKWLLVLGEIIIILVAGIITYKKSDALWTLGVLLTGLLAWLIIWIFFCDKIPWMLLTALTAIVIWTVRMLLANEKPEAENITKKPVNKPEQNSKS